MLDIKKSIIFDIEQRYFLINKINEKTSKPLFLLGFIRLILFNQQNLKTI